MSEKINRMIPMAMRAIETSGMMKKDGSVASEYKGYIVSMAASIMRTGLLTSITFYTRSSKSDSEGNTTKDMRKAADTNPLLGAIFTLIRRNKTEDTSKNLLEYVLINCVDDYNGSDPVKMSDLNHNKLDLLADEIQDALYALKLALRTFDLKKSTS